MSRVPKALRKILPTVAKIGASVAVAILIIGSFLLMNYQRICGARASLDAHIYLRYWSVEFKIAEKEAAVASSSEIPALMERMREVRNSVDNLSEPDCAQKARRALLNVFDAKLELMQLQQASASSNEIAVATDDVRNAESRFNDEMEKDWTPPTIKLIELMLNGLFG